jgi:hypothetical protein
MSIGEDRVRIKFNPSASNLVDDIKQRTAALIDMCEERKEARAQPAPLLRVARSGFATICTNRGPLVGFLA